MKSKLNFLNFWLALGAMSFLGCEMAVLLLSDGGTGGLVSSIWFSNFVLIALSIFGWRGVLANRKNRDGQKLLFYGQLLFAIGPLCGIQFTVMPAAYDVFMLSLSIAINLMAWLCLMEVVLQKSHGTAKTA